MSGTGSKVTEGLRAEKGERGPAGRATFLASRVKRREAFTAAVLRLDAEVQARVPGLELYPSRQLPAKPHPVRLKYWDPCHPHRRTALSSKFLAQPPL